MPGYLCNSCYYVAFKYDFRICTGTSFSTKKWPHILFFSGKKHKPGNNVTSLNFLTFRVLQRIVWLRKANCNLRGYFPVPGGTKCWGEFYSFSILLYCRNSSLQVEFNPIKPQKRIKELKFRLVKWRTTRYSCCAIFSIKRALQWVTG